MFDDVKKPSKQTEPPADLPGMSGNQKIPAANQQRPDERPSAAQETQSGSSSVSSDQKDNKPAGPVQDIFADTEATPAPFNSDQTEAGLSTSDGRQSPPAMTSMPAGSGGGSRRRILVLLLAVIIIGIIGVAGYLGYQMFTQRPGILDNESSNQPTEDNNGVETNENTNVTVAPDQSIDTDNDGLTDEEESEYNTDPLLPDTDNDGLFDREEVRVYKTNPLEPDTDGDGYLDGEEVKSGYNPNGPGELLPSNPSDFNQ